MPSACHSLCPEPGGLARRLARLLCTSNAPTCPLHLSRRRCPGNACKLPSAVRCVRVPHARHCHADCLHVQLCPPWPTLRRGSFDFAQDLFLG
eukprot:9251161-Karenia_brevis.AAC.1